MEANAAKVFAEILPNIFKYGGRFYLAKDARMKKECLKNLKITETKSAL